MTQQGKIDEMKALNFKKTWQGFNQTRPNFNGVSLLGVALFGCLEKKRFYTGANTLEENGNCPRLFSPCITASADDVNASLSVLLSETLWMRKRVMVFSV